MRATARAARASLREWWPELLCGGLLVLISQAGQKDDGLFAVFCAITGGIFWAMGYRHRSLSLHRKVDRMTEGVGEMIGELRRDRSDTEVRDDGPRLRLVKGWRHGA